MAKPPNQVPRISVNKLAEFMTAKGARQRVILHDQKYPTDYKGMYYREAAEAIASAVASNLENMSSVDNMMNYLAQQTPDKIGTQRRIASNIDALDSFLAMLDDIDLKGATPQLGEQSPPRLIVYGVQISVRPEIVLCGKGKAGVTLCGALKLHFSRTFSLTADTAGYVSAVLQEWGKVHLTDKGEVNGPLCPVIDVGSKSFYPGVKATSARMKDVEACCQNIAALWPTI